MTYSSGGLIQVTDYNTRVASVNSIWSTGSGNSGYGQTAQSTNSTGDVVTASQWATMIAKMQAMQQHQSNNTTGVPSQPGAGSIITYLSTVDSCITTVTNNRLNVAAYGSSTTSSASNATSWDGHAYRTWTVTFSSGDAARYFFNAGGYIQLNFSGTSLSGNSKSTYWNTFLTSGINYWNFFQGSSSYGGTGFTPSTNNTGQGYYSLTTTPTTWFQIYDNPSSADYTSNYAYIQVNSNGTNVSGHNDAGSVLTFVCNLIDAASDTGGSADQVTGTTQVNLVVVPPWTTYLSASWGTPSISNTVNSQGVY